MTHLIWDGFTHERAAGVRMFPILADFGPAIDGHSLQLYRWLQYGSSVLGLGVVLIALGIWLRHATPPPMRPTRRLAALERGFWLRFYVLMPLIAMSPQFWNVHSLFQAPGAKLTLIAETGMRASALTLVLLSLTIRVRLAAKRRSR